MPTNVHMLTDDGLDQTLAEECGLCWHQWYLSSVIAHEHLYVCEKCGIESHEQAEIAPPHGPRFSCSFDALLSIKERDGFDGPVERAYSKANSVVNGAPYPQAYRDFHKLFPTKGWFVHTEVFRMIRNLLDRGPRPLAETALVALVPEKYMIGESDA